MTSNTDRISRDEAHDLYMRIFGDFALGHSDVEDVKRTNAVVEAINVRLADVGSQQTIVDDAVNGGERFWQCFQTYDSWTEAEAEAAFNHAWPADLVMDAIAPKAAKARAARPSTTAPATACRCGCGSQTRKGKGYLPGHDARHAGYIARHILALMADGHDDPWSELQNLPTGALRVKARAQVERATAAQAQVKAAKAIRNGTATVERRDGTVVNGYVRVPVPYNRIGKRIPAVTYIRGGETGININDLESGKGDWLDGEGYLDKPAKFWLKRFRPAPVKGVNYQH